MDMVRKNGKMVPNILECGKIINLMDMENLNGPMEEFIKGSGLMVKWKGLDS